jgi:uridylate kinase
MKYGRILLKLSGESLAGKQKDGFSIQVLASYARQIKQAADAGVQIGIVVGGGNIYRGAQGFRNELPPSISPHHPLADRHTSVGELAPSGARFDRVKGDQMGMLATVINSLALQNALADAGAKCKVLTSIRMEPVGELFSKDKALEYLANGYVVIIGGGTGNPYFTTDTAAALRGIEIEADVFLKGTRVDGVYTADPEKDPSATKFDTLSFGEVYERGLKIMDLTAFTMCRENGLPVVVFDMDTEGNLDKVLHGDKIGTLIK